MNRYVKKGGRSFYENKGRYTNPYAPGSFRYNSFERGWSQALKRSPDSLFNEFEDGETPDLTSNLIEHYECERKVIYRDEVYRVRDNGAIFRELREGGRRRKLDSIWTFGRPNVSTGYMNFCALTVHRIVATAFHGEPPDENYIVDHIDTNRRNNRAENLRWITRVENILKNPITMRRIELSYGSLSEFFRNPSQPKRKKLPKNYEWMRTVSKEEAQASRERIQRWAESGAQPKGGRLGEWVYASRIKSAPPVQELIRDSLTPCALQRNWRVPTEFPSCPDGRRENALSRYEERLAPGETFSRNKFGSSVVVIAELGDSGQLSVITQLGDNSVKPFAVARVVREGQMIVHENGGTFFNLEGAAKAHCEKLNVPWKEHCDRSGLPWGDSIDNYC